MKSFFLWSYAAFARTCVALTRRGTWFFAKHAPKGHTMTLPYLTQSTITVTTTYPLEASIWLFGEFDAPCMNFLKKNLKPGMTFIDVGANCGAFTLAAAEALGGSGHIYAFEPGPPLLPRLYTNLSLNPQAKNITTVVPLGLGKEHSTFFYQESEEIRGNASLLHTSGIPVSVVAFDTWASEHHISHADVIKIDVEGMEYDVLLGMQKLLEASHPTLFFETDPAFHTTPGKTLRELFTMLRAMGYRLFSGDGDDAREVYPEGPYPHNTIARKI